MDKMTSRDGVMTSRDGVMTSRDSAMTARDRKVSFAAKIGVKEISTTSTTSEAPKNNKFHDYVAADCFIIDKNKDTDSLGEEDKAMSPTSWLIRDMFKRNTDGKLSEFGEVKISTQDQVIWGTTDTVSVFVWSLKTNLHAKFRGIYASDLLK